MAEVRLAEVRLAEVRLAGIGFMMKLGYVNVR